MKKAFKVVVGAIGMMVFLTLMTAYTVWPSYVYGDGSWQFGAWVIGNFFIACLAFMYAHISTNGE